MSAGLVLGADVGGTSSRVAVTDTDGRLLAVRRGGPGNPKSVGPEVAAATIAATLAECLQRVGGTPGKGGRFGPADLSAVTLALAGLTGIADLPGFVARALPGVDPAAVTVVPDLVAAFASGTPESSGYVVLAGTGAGAMAIVDGEVAGRHDAWGWLLGDEGSGFWLGREAVRATLTALEPAVEPPARPGRPQQLGPLSTEVLRRTGTTDFASLLAESYQRPPRRLAELAPAVTETAATDPVAAGICDRAGALLVDSFRALHPVPGRTVVTTGSVLNPTSPVRAALVQAIGGSHGRDRPAHPIHSARDGLAGSLWLALRRWHRDQGDGHWPGAGATLELHTRLVRSVAAATPD